VGGQDHNSSTTPLMRAKIHLIRGDFYFLGGNIQQQGSPGLVSSQSGVNLAEPFTTGRWDKKKGMAASFDKELIGILKKPECDMRRLGTGFKYANERSNRYLSVGT